MGFMAFTGGTFRPIPRRSNYSFVKKSPSQLAKERKENRLKKIDPAFAAQVGDMVEETETSYD